MNDSIIDYEKESLFNKKFTCPNCDNLVLGKTVKTGKTKLTYTDADLRPNYESIDSLKYDGIVCNHCGYSAVRRYFTDTLIPVQKKYVNEKVTVYYQPKASEPEIYSYEEAIRRLKLSYISCIAKDADASELAYTFLKTAWVYRSYQNDLRYKGSNDDSKISELEMNEQKYLQQAYLKFKQAYAEEDGPICGMDQATLFYIISYLAYNEEEYNESKRWLALVLKERNASENLKERARELKDLLKKVMETEV